MEDDFDAPHGAVRDGRVLQIALDETRAQSQGSIKAAKPPKPAGVLPHIETGVPRDRLDSLPGWVPKTVVSLGLDLQGGSHLLYEVDTTKFLNERLESVVNDIRDKLTKGETKFGYLNLGAKNGVVSLTLRDPNQVDAARPLLQQATVDMDLKIGSDGAVTAQYTDATLARLKAQLSSRHDR